MARTRLHSATRKDNKTNSIDRQFLVLTIVLSIVGLVAVADASAPQALNTFDDPYYFIKQQMMWAGIGYVLLFTVMFLPYTVWKRIAGLAFIGTLAMLLLVLVPGVGARIYGARRWFVVAGVSIQPAEIMKLALALIFARFADLKYSWMYYVGTLGLTAGLIMLQPDLGTTIVVVAIGLTQLFIAGIPLLYFIGVGAAGTLLGGVAILLSDYRRERLMTYFQNSVDPLGTSYHIRQVLIALGSGGLVGVGIGQSRQKQLFLPETATDSVFAVIAEEVGFVGASLIIIVMTYYIMRALKIAKRAPDDFSRVLAIGIVAWLAAQTFLNIASMVALTPLTGIPLPFMSYGGSSLTMILLSAGIMLNISKHGK